MATAIPLRRLNTVRRIPIAAFGLLKVIELRPKPTELYGILKLFSVFVIKKFERGFKSILINKLLTEVKIWGFIVH